jgi:hypothetical protein
MYEALGQDNKYVFTKMQLDKAAKDKKHLTEDFQVEFYFLLPQQLRDMLKEGGTKKGRDGRREDEGQ